MDALLRRRLMMQQGGGPTPPPPPPYDAQVEYLSSNASQYIDTGIYGDGELDFEVKVNVSAATAYYNVLGDRYSSTSRRWSLMLYPRAGNYNHIYFNCGDSNEVIPAQSYGAAGWHIFKKEGTYCYVDGTMVGTLSEQTFTTPYTVLLFGLRNNGTLSNMLKGDIAYCRLSKNGVLLRNYIPVRVGQVGYMYDEVTGQLYGNVGTGDFTLGPDVV